MFAQAPSDNMVVNLENKLFYETQKCRKGRCTYYETMSYGFAFLSNSVDPTDCLCFYCWIEKRLDKNNMLRFQKIEAVSSMLNQEQ